MNEPYAADNSYSNLAETRKLEEKAHLINEGLNAGRKIAKISIITLSQHWYSRTYGWTDKR